MKKKRKPISKSEWMLLLMLLPGLIYLLINNYGPMSGLFIAFKNINYAKGIFRSPWVGLSNFKFLFSTNDAWLITRNTLLYNTAFIILNQFFGILFAITLNEIAFPVLKKIYQTVLLMPQLVSMVVVSYMAYAFLSGDSGFINNSVLSMFHIDKINWYQESKYWPFILIFIQVWKQVGYSTLLYLASIVSIDKSLYEAAEVDGAYRIQQIFRITLPLLKSTTITLILLMIGRIFYSDFGLFYQVPMDSGALYEVTQTIDTYVYRGLLGSNSNIGMSSAASLYQSVIGFAVVMASNLLVRKIDSENALF